MRAAKGASIHICNDRTTKQITIPHWPLHWSTRTATISREVEKFVTGTNSTQQVNEDHHGKNIPHRGPQTAPSENCQKPTRTKWSRKEYKEVMEAYYKAI